MRERFGSDIQYKISYIVVVFGVAFAVSFAPLHPVTALPLLGLTDDEATPAANDPSAELVEPEEEKLQLATGTPQPTSSSILKQGEARLTWTPTGLNDIQDTYDVAVTTIPEEETAEPPLQVSEAEGLTSAEFDVSSLAEGAYQWQVRSCGGTGVCSTWSQYTRFTLDGTPPAQPAAAVTSGQYDMVVRLQGTAEPQSNVTVTVSERSCSTKVDETGLWSCEFQKSFVYGQYTANVTATDIAGNKSQARKVAFAVKELFVSEPITAQELPETIEIVPVTTKPENQVLRQPVAAVDIVEREIAETKEAQDTTPVVAAITTDGGIVKASESGWQFMGLPWFLWLAGAGSAFAGWRVFGSPLPRGIGSIFSL